jgi:hypothetical protein
VTEPIDDVLPLFQGKRPDATTLSLTGGTDATLHHAYSIDQQVVFLVRGQVAKVGHKRVDKVGLVREQQLKVESAWDLRTVMGVEDIAGIVKELQGAAADVRGEVFGFPQQPLPAPDPDPDGELP